MHAVPGIRLALEAPPYAFAPVQTIASETSAPSGVAWSTAITAAAALEIISIDVGCSHGLWVHREFPAGGAVANSQESALECSFKGV